MNEETRRHFLFVEGFKDEERNLAALQRKAQEAARAAIARGDLTPPGACSRCQRKTRVYFHHHKGYAPEFWLVGEWLCGGCHKASPHPELDDLRARMARATHECDAWVVGTLGKVIKARVVIDGRGRKKIADGESYPRWVFFDEKEAAAFAGDFVRSRRDGLLTEAAALDVTLASLGLSALGP